MTLNVYSLSNKKTAVTQYLHDTQVHVAVITETHIPVDRKEELHLDGYTPISSCCREQGRQKGGIVILVHTTVPCEKGYDMVASAENEMEHCAATLYPNHTRKEVLQIVGIYRPPERVHPPYQEALNKMLEQAKTSQIATIVMGDYNKNAW